MEQKRDDLLRDLRKAARKAGEELVLVRSTGGHDQYRIGATTVPVPRHKVIGPKVAFEIRKAFEPELGHRWWR